MPCIYTVYSTLYSLVHTGSLQFTVLLSPWPRPRSDVSGEREEQREESSFNCGAERKASDGFAQAGAPLWALLWKK